jgi:hypothetical protein
MKFVGHAQVLEIDRFCENPDANREAWKNEKEKIESSRDKPRKSALAGRA